MPHYWNPDTCPDFPPCKFEIDATGIGFVSHVRACKFHQALIDGGTSPKALFDRVLQRNRDKNYGTYEIAQLLGVDHVRVLWSIDQTELIRVRGILQPDGTVLTIRGAGRNSAQSACDTRIGAGKLVID